MLVENANQIKDKVKRGELKIPFVQKARTEGYDGRGVQIIRAESDLEQLFDRPSVIEHLVKIKQEIAVLAARSVSGDIVVYPSVEMSFHPTANLVEQLISPARISVEIEEKAHDLTRKLIADLKMVGLLAVEFFITVNDELLVNEAAPRPHNSGHHTIEANVTSQYEQHLRAILDLPLGDPSLKSPAIMINLLGEEGYQGEVFYRGLEECLGIPNVHVHLYGKKETKPFRKMGHVTVLDEDIERAIAKASKVSEILRVVS
jgi:5-(carboxyamino)imidazole ribonucleotide synthase